MEQPLECGIVDTAQAWVSTWSRQIPLLLKFVRWSLLCRQQRHRTTLCICFSTVAATGGQHYCNFSSPGDAAGQWIRVCCSNAKTARVCIFSGQCMGGITVVANCCCRSLLIVARVLRWRPPLPEDHRSTVDTAQPLAGDRRCWKITAQLLTLLSPSPELVPRCQRY